MVAIGIVVVLLAISAPAIVNSFGDRRIEAEAERLAAAMASLRAESVRQRETLAIYLVPGTESSGGELFIGSLRGSIADQPDDDPSAPLPVEPQPGDPMETKRDRSIFRAEAPLRLTIDRPSMDPLEDSLAVPAMGAEVPASMPEERIRIAVCSASGQMLASRPVWLHDGRGMMSVELGTAVGNAMVSSWRVIPDPGAAFDGFEEAADPTDMPLPPDPEDDSR